MSYAHKNSYQMAEGRFHKRFDTKFEGEIEKPISRGWGLKIAVRKRRRGSSAATLALLAFLHGRLSRKLSRAEERRLVGRERRDG